jgi:SAM-dependent methyltransferase
MSRLETLVRIKHAVMSMPDDTALVEATRGMIQACDGALGQAEYHRLGQSLSESRQHYTHIHDIIQKARALRHRALDELDFKIIMLEDEYIKRDEKSFSVSRHHQEGLDKTRVLMPDSSIESLVRARMGKLVSWQYPGLELRPGDGTWTKRLVACEPLYLADIDVRLMDPAVAQFNSAYQKKLRLYESSPGNVGALPLGQFGFVFSWGYFNFLPFALIRDYLRDVLRLLRPGGTFMFSYNNSELFPEAAHRVETSYMTHAPKRLLLFTARALGYDVTGEFDFAPDISWLELTRPGELTSCKSHPVLGQIIKE